MYGVILVVVVFAIIVACAIVGARRGTEQVTVYGDPETERHRARNIGTGSRG